MDGRWSIPLAALALVLAGCGDDAPRTDDVVVIESGTTATVGPDTRVEKGPAGDLKGHVLDEALRPVQGAKVVLPGLGLERRTDENGAFAFVDLLPGPYFLQADATGFLPLNATVDVAEATISQVRILLVRAPVEDPFHETQKFTAYADVALPFVSGLLECDCSFRIALSAPAQTLVLESARSGGPNGGGFSYEVLDAQGRRIASGSATDPMVVRLDAGLLRNGTQFLVDVQPYAGTVPETAVDFEVFATSFHNAPAPQNWSIREDS